jgi:hypothetical protein
VNDGGIWRRGSGETSLLTTCVCTAAFFPVFGVTFHIEGAGSSLSGCVCYLVYLFSAHMFPVIRVGCVASIVISLTIVTCIDLIDNVDLARPNLTKSRAMVPMIAPYVVIMGISIVHRGSEHWQLLLLGNLSA